MHLIFPKIKFSHLMGDPLLHRGQLHIIAEKLGQKSMILFQNHKELKERSRTQQLNATSDIAFDHLDSLDAARNKKQ